MKKVTKEEVYITREYVLVTMIHKTAPPPEEIGRIGFRLSAQNQVCFPRVRAQLFPIRIMPSTHS